MSKIIDLPIKKIIAKKEFNTRKEAIEFGQKLGRNFIWGQLTSNKKWKVFLMPEDVKMEILPPKEGEVISLFPDDDKEPA